MEDARTPVRLKERERTNFELSLNHVFSLLTREFCVGILGVWFFDFPFPVAFKYLSQDHGEERWLGRCRSWVLLGPLV